MAKTPEDISKELREPFPADVIDEKNGLLYIPHEIIRDRLIGATDNQFDWSIDQILFRDDGATRRGIDRNTGEVRRPLSMVVVGTLTIPGLGKRTGVGAHPIDEGSGEDAAYKSADSDAFKRAAMTFGVGLHQLYIETGEAKRAQKPGRQPPRNQASSQRATSRPQTLQHAAKTTMPDDVFGPEVRRAIEEKDGERLRQLVDEAGENVARWIALVKACDRVEALDWTVKQIERRGIADPLLLTEIAKQRATFGKESPSPAVRQARRENALPGGLVPEDEIERGVRKAAELTMS